MKKQLIAVSFMLYCILAGCGIMNSHQRQNVAGTWIGKSVVGHKEICREWKATLKLNEDMTFTLAYENEGESRKVLMGNYSIDLTKKPARIDFSNVGFSKGVTSTCCLAIAGFSGKGKMIVSGLFGKCGKIQRPERFDCTPSDNHQLYLELKKSSTE